MGDTPPGALPRPADNQVDLWLLDTRTLADDRLARYQQLLSEQEAAQYERYVLAKARREHLAARALLRSCLSRYAPVPPDQWRFARQEQGKPLIAAPSLQPPLYFNLSHSRGLLLCAVSSRPEIGVDLEHTARVRDLLRVARVVLAPAELAQLTSLPASEQRQRFFFCWTLKEAYLKARGTGMRLPLRQIAFETPDAGAIQAQLGPQLGDDPARWWFASFCPAKGFLAAVAYSIAAQGEQLALVSRTISL